LIPVKGRIHTIPRGLIHLGIILILIGVFVSSSMKIDNGTKVITPGSTIKNLNIEVTFGNFTLVEPFGSVYYQGSSYPQAAGIAIPVHVKNGGIVTDGVIKAYYYTLNGVVAEPYVALGIDDAYITVYVSDQLNNALNSILSGSKIAPPHVSVSLVINPLVNLIWFGSLIMCVGIITQMIIHPIKVLEVQNAQSPLVKKGKKSKN
jgi:cytochrome c biogenesis factor